MLGESQAERLVLIHPVLPSKGAQSFKDLRALQQKIMKLARKCFKTVTSISFTGTDFLRTMLINAIADLCGVIRSL